MVFREITEEEDVIPKYILLKVKRVEVLPEEAGYAVNILSLAHLPKLAKRLKPNSPPIALVYNVAKDESALVVASLTFIEDFIDSWTSTTIKPFPIVIVVSQDALDPKKVKTMISRRLKDDIELVIRDSILIIESFKERMIRHKYVVDINVQPKIFLMAAPAFTTKEIIIEYSDGIELHKISIPLRKSSWRITDFPQKIVDEIETIIVKPYVSKKPYAPRGAIIVGPPGVGKSSLAEAIADALGTKIVRLTPSTYRSMWYGATERILSSIFDKLRDRRDVTVIIDDAEFITGRHYAIHEVSIAEVSLLLNILQDPHRPFTILTSNAPELIDPALLRPGRIDITIIMGYPDRASRRKAVEVLLNRYGIKVTDDIIEDIVMKTKWFSHAEIDALIRLAASKSGDRLTPEAIDWAYRRFTINVGERRRMQEYLKWYIDKLQGMVIAFIASETEI